MIALRNIRKQYNDTGIRVTALDGVNLTISNGEVCGIVGHRGSGKTTLLRCMTLLDPPDSGIIEFNRQVASSLRGQARLALQRQMGTVLQRHGLLASATVFDNVALPLRWVHPSHGSAAQRVASALDWLGLSDLARRYPAELQPFEQRRVALARAIVHGPRVLLCDNIPDDADRGQFLAILQRIQRASGMTMILISRVMDLLETVCNRVAVLNHGQVIENGTVDDVVRNPREAITYDFVQWGTPSTRLAEAAAL